MANKKFWLGMLVVVLAFGMTVVGCDDDSTSGENPKVIKITAINGKTGSVGLYILASPYNESGVMAFGQGTISNNSVTIPLKKPDGGDFTGTGSGIIWMTIRVSDAEDGSSYYYYTDGKTFQELGLSGTGNWDNSKLPKYNIKNTTSTIDFSKFKEAD
jgi:hypothetical protein